MSATTLRRRLPGARIAAGMAAVGAKELRGRMRGRRAFVIVTIYLLLLSLFAWGIYQFKLEFRGNIFSDSGLTGGGIDVPLGVSGALAATTRSAEIGHALFAGLLVLLTILVLVLAPALTSGAISQEREKQTLELLVATPLSTTGMVISKLLSALVYLFLLILASIPVASVVFTFGGVGPEDVLRAYALLLAVAFGVGAIGLFCSAVARRTQVATVLSYITVLALTIGSYVLWVFMYGVASSGSSTLVDGRFVRRLPPQQVLWMNPLIADLDVLCGAGLDQSCEVIGRVTNRPWFGSFTTGNTRLPEDGQAAGGGGVLGAPGNAAGAVADCAADVVPCNDVGIAQAVDPIEVVFTPPRDLLWPQVSLTFVGVGLLLTLISAQLVAPTRRLRLPPLLGRRGPASGSAPEAVIVEPGTATPLPASAGEPAAPAAAWGVAPVQPSQGGNADPSTQEASR